MLRRWQYSYSTRVLDAAAWEGVLTCKHSPSTAQIRQVLSDDAVMIFDPCGLNDTCSHSLGVGIPSITDRTIARHGGWLSYPLDDSQWFEQCTARLGSIHGVSEHTARLHWC